jgi:hypothetical protein
MRIRDWMLLFLWEFFMGWGSGFGEILFNLIAI